MVATGRVPRLTRVDAHLKLLAEVSLAVERAEAAAGEGGFTSAREALDEAETGLQVLRERWPEMAAAERALVGRAAAPVKQRLDAVARQTAASERAEPGRARARSRAGAGPRGGVESRAIRAAVLTAVSLLLAACLAASAQADVLVERPASALRCGQSIRTGVWYRDFPTTGHRQATIEVLSARGIVLERRQVTATSHWRTWHYEPRCGRHYRVRYTTFAGVSSFRIWVRRA